MSAASGPSGPRPTTLPWRRQDSWQEHAQEEGDLTSRRTHWQLSDGIAEVEDDHHAWTLPEVQHPAEVPAWVRMEEPLRDDGTQSHEWPFVEPTFQAASFGVSQSIPFDSGPLDEFEFAASRVGAPLRGGKTCESLASSICRKLAVDYREACDKLDESENVKVDVFSLRQVTESLDAALYTFIKAYQAKEQREKDLQEEAEKIRAEERRQLEKQVREEHSIRMIEAAAAVADVASEVPVSKTVGWCCCKECCTCEKSQQQACPCFCYGSSDRLVVSAAAPEVVEQAIVSPAGVNQNQASSLTDATQNLQHQLDLALAMMQKRLGGDKPFISFNSIEFVPKPPDAQPNDPVVVHADSEEEKAKRAQEEKRAKEVDDFERKTRDAELRAATAIAERAREFDQLGTPLTDGSMDFHNEYDISTNEAIDRILSDNTRDAGSRKFSTTVGHANPQGDLILLPDEEAFLGRPSLAQTQPCAGPSDSYLLNNSTNTFHRSNPISDRIIDAQTRLNHNRQCRRIAQAKGILDRSLDARECLDRARALRVAVSGELRAAHP